jgi:hypothetical protein
MLTRALIVVLAILNLGVACWWLLRDAPQACAAAATAGVAELRWVPGGVDAAGARPCRADRLLMEREPAEKTAVAATPAPAVPAKPEIAKPQRLRPPPRPLPSRQHTACTDRHRKSPHPARGRRAALRRAGPVRRPRRRDRAQARPACSARCACANSPLPAAAPATG